MLELAILGLLKDRSMHGYELSKRLTRTLGGFWRVSYGSLYPTLKRLERQGAVEQVTGDVATLARRKHVYRITEDGERLFLKLLEEVGSDSSTEDTRFRIRLAFFRYLAPDTRIRVLERRRASLEERLSTITSSLRDGEDTDDPYTRSLMQHGRDVTAQDIAWLDGLIAAERLQITTTTDGRTRRASAREARAIRRKERTT
ncbi:MAG: PadR family transcriptional regulator [Actinomycetota bacterium]